jgi:hypothetical protein
MQLGAGMIHGAPESNHSVVRSGKAGCCGPAECSTLEEIAKAAGEFRSTRRKAKEEMSSAIVWKFDSLETIAGHPVEVVGAPQLIDTPAGKAIQFNGAEVIYLPVHPLAGAATFTWEIVFRPDGGDEEQRFFHLQEQDATTGADGDGRMLFELRVIGDQWCLDGFVKSGENGLTLIDRQKLFPLGKWYRVTLVFDGTTVKAYVGDALQGEGTIAYQPHLPGHTSVGMRINRISPFKGAVLSARMTPRALAVEEFLAVPEGL